MQTGAGQWPWERPRQEDDICRTYTGSEWFGGNLDVYEIKSWISEKHLEN